MIFFRFFFTKNDVTVTSLVKNMKWRHNDVKMTSKWRHTSTFANGEDRYCQYDQFGMSLLPVHQKLTILWRFFVFSSIRVIWRHQSDYDVITVKIDQNPIFFLVPPLENAEPYRMSHWWWKLGNIWAIFRGVSRCDPPLVNEGTRKSWLIADF